MKNKRMSSETYVPMPVYQKRTGALIVCTRIQEIQRVMLSSSDEITRLEGEIGRASNQGNMHKLGASQHLQAVEIACVVAFRPSRALRESLLHLSHTNMQVPRTGRQA